MSAEMAALCVIGVLGFVVLLRVAFLFGTACKRLDEIEKHLRPRRRMNGE